MKFPAYWSRATASEADRNGKLVTCSCWRWSDESVEDAHAKALTAAERAVQHLLAGRRSGRYPYGQTPLREEVLQTFAGPEGKLLAAITVNAYGALVLNTAGVMFVDVDFPPVAPGEQLRWMFGRLFGKSARSPEARRVDEARDRIEQLINRQSAWGARLYRTCAGLRLLVTHDMFDPAADATQTIFDSLGADPLYARLCRGQRSFRARLTPKPWRCGHAPNRIAWPRQSPDDERAYENWRSAYATRHSVYATCRFVESLGNDRLHPEARRIIEVHDDITRANVAAALA